MEITFPACFLTAPSWYFAPKRLFVFPFELPVFARGAGIRETKYPGISLNDDTEDY